MYSGANNLPLRSPTAYKIPNHGALAPANSCLSHGEVTANFTCTDLLSKGTTIE